MKNLTLFVLVELGIVELERFWIWNSVKLEFEDFLNWNLKISRSGNQLSGTPNLY